MTLSSFRNLTLLAALLLVCGFFAVDWTGLTHGQALSFTAFFSPRNMSLLAIDFSITAVLALAMLVVILPGHIDLSAGSGVGLVGGIAAVLVANHGWSAPAAMGVGLGVALLLWCIMGQLIVRQRVPAFIITLGGMLLFKGVFWMVIENNTVPVVRPGQHNALSLLTTFYLPKTWGLALAGLVVAGLWFFSRRADSQRTANGLAAEDGELGFLRVFIAAQLVFLFVLVTNQFRGVPLPALLLGGVALLVWCVTRQTRFGRYLYAIGGNEEAAHLSGVPVAGVTIGAFTLAGAIVALTGWMQTAYVGASTTTVGDQMELDAVAACVIGGASLKGGRGSVTGVLFGALIMACLLNGMTLMAVQPEMKFIARGLVLIAAVWLDVRFARKAGA